MSRLYANFAESVLLANILAGDLSLSIPLEDDGLFPVIPVGDEFELTLFDGQQQPEIVRATARTSGGVFTIERAQQGTVATDWQAGTQVRLALTAGALAEFLTKLFGYSVVGNDNAGAGPTSYGMEVTRDLTNGLVAGDVVTFVADIGNIGGVTLNITGPNANMVSAPVMANGMALATGQISAGELVTAVWDGTEFQLGGFVTTSDLENGAVTTAKIADAAVITLKLADGAVTEDKLATDSVGGTELQPDSVDTDELVDESVTIDKIDTAEVTKDGLLKLLGTINYVEDIAALRLLIGPGSASNGYLVYVKGYDDEGDGGGGFFRWDNNSVEADNGGTVILPTGYVAAGRWVRPEAPYVDVRWFGVFPTNVNSADDVEQADAAAIDRNVPLVFPPEEYVFGRVITLNSPAIRGESQGITRLSGDDFGVVLGASGHVIFSGIALEQTAAPGTTTPLLQLGHATKTEYEIHGCGFTSLVNATAELGAGVEQHGVDITIGANHIIRIDACTFTNLNKGVYVDVACGLDIQHTVFQSCGHCAVGDHTSGTFNFTENYVVDNAYAAVTTKAGVSTQISLNQFEQDTTQVLPVTGPSGAFTIGETLTGITSGATGVVAYEADIGADVALTVVAVSGTFQAAEVVSGSLSGSSGTTGATLYSWSQETHIAKNNTAYKYLCLPYATVDGECAFDHNTLQPSNSGYDFYSQGVKSFGVTTPRQSGEVYKFRRGSGLGGLQPSMVDFFSFDADGNLTTGGRAIIQNPYLYLRWAGELNAAATDTIRTEGPVTVSAPLFARDWVWATGAGEGYGTVPFDGLYELYFTNNNTASGTNTYVFEVATDTAFTSIVSTFTLKVVDYMSGWIIPFEANAGEYVRLRIISGGCLTTDESHTGLRIVYLGAKV